MAKKIRVKSDDEPVVSISRNALQAERFVYVLAVNRLVKYAHGRSRIIYIGTTKKGVRRVASSIAHHAESALAQHGMKHIHAYLLTYQGQHGVQQMWRKLERAVLFVFKHQYGSTPLLNTQGRNFWPKDEFKYFSERTLLKKLRKFEQLPHAGKHK